MTDATQKTPLDFSFSNHGTIVSIEPMTPEAIAWIDENVQTEGYQWLGRRLGVEARYFEPIYAGIVDAGFNV